MTHKSSDYKISAVNYYLDSNENRLAYEDYKKIQIMRIKEIHKENPLIQDTLVCIV